MRKRIILPVFAALGLTLGLAACDERPPKPAFTEKSAQDGAEGSETRTADASAQGAAPTLPPQGQTAANCCACPPAQAPACPEAKPVRAAKAPARPAARSRPTRQARATPAPRAPAPRDYAHRGPAPSQGEGYRRYQGPDIATRGGYERRQEQYAGGYQDQYRGHHQGQYQEQYREQRQEQYQARRHEEQRYAYAPPPPPPYVHGRVEQYDAYSEHRSYSQQSSGYVQGVAAGPCCGGPPVQAAGRDAGGYLTWPGKRPPAPYY